MSSDLRVALRIQANAGNSRREIERVNKDLRQAGKEGARALADESWKAANAVTRIGRSGASSYGVVRTAMRETAKAGSKTRIELSKTEAEFKALAQAARKAARDAKTELASADRQGVQPLRQSVEKTESSFRRLAQTGGRQLRTLKTVAAGVRKEFDRIKSLGSSAQGKLAGLGAGFGVASALTGSARLDRDLIRTRQTAEMSAAEKDDWHREGFRIARSYGVDRESVDGGFSTLIASGVKYDAARKTADAIGQANAVTGADSAVLGKAVVAASSAYDIDLNKDGAAADLLQKMTVGGRLGNAELENLADLFPKIGGAARAAGMSLAQALAFTETLSTVELQPDRLGTLTESTLRIFSKKEYRDQIKKTSGVNFFNKDGSSREAGAVLGDLKRKYDKLKTDEQRERFMGVVFKGMDQDTVRGVRTMLSGTRLADFSANSKVIGNAGPVLAQDLKENTQSASGTAARMKATLGEAIDRMATPINKSLADIGSYLLDDLNLSGEQMLAGGAALGVGGYYAGRGLKAAGGGLLAKALGGADTLKNIAVGKVLEDATGVSSVFVTNWPDSAGTLGAPSKVTASKGKPDGVIAPWIGPVGLGLVSTQLSGSTGQQSDNDRLALVARSKLLNDSQKRWQSAFYQNRIDLVAQQPDASQDWVSSQASRLAQHQTGLTPSGVSVESANAWASGIADRAMEAGAATRAAVEQLQRLLGQPLVIEVRTDSNMIMAEVERRTDLQMRRGQ